MRELFCDALPMLWHHGCFSLRTVTMAVGAGVLVGMLVAFTIAG